MKKGKRLTTVSLAVALAVSLVGCGNAQKTGDTTNVQNTKGEYTYVPEYITLDSEGANFYNAQLQGDSLYYTSYEWDETTQTDSESLIEYSITEQKVIKEQQMGNDESNRNINGFQIGSDGSLITVEYAYSEDYSESTIFLCKYDAQGVLVKEQDITDIINSDEENSYVDKMVLDGEGRLYLTSSELIRLFDAEFNFSGQVSLNGNWLNSLGQGKDGKVYGTYYDQAAMNNSYCIAEIDFNGKKLGTVYNNFPGGNSNMLSVGIEKDFLAYNNEALYEYDKTSQTYEKLLSWLDCDINGTYVQSVGSLEDGRIIALIDDWETGGCEIALLKKTKTSEVVQKTEIVIGTIGLGQELQAAAVQFNKSSDTYRVTINNYVDEMNWTETSYQDAINRLNNDLLSENSCPDIIDLSSMNMKQLANKGIIADMAPYLEKSTVLSKEDFLENIIEGYTFNERLIGIPKTFNLQTLVGRASDVGEEPGWTLDELIAYAEANPNAALLEGATKTQILQYLFMYSQDDYVDWESGECKFESEEFKKLLTFVASFPDEYDWASETRSTPIMIQDGDVLMDTVFIDQFNSIQIYEAMYGEAVTFIGYPTVDGSNGCMLYASGVYGIAEKSENKDGAWAFIEHYLSSEANDMFSWGFSSKKAELEAVIEEELNVEYLKDENGELILDENGEPIPLGGGGGIGYGDWEYTYHPVTQEEVDVVLELMESAKTVSAYNEEITNIILEDAEPFFMGQKSVEDVAGIIQSRVQLYVNENQ